MLETRCRKAEQQQEESQARATALELEVQELRAKLAASGDAKAQALWKAAEGAVGGTAVWQEVRTKHEEWFTEAQSNLDQRHCAQIWRLLRENYSVAVLSNVAQVVGEGAVVVGRLLFDTTSNQTASVQKTMGASQAIMETVLERQHRKSNGNEISISHLEGGTQKPLNRSPEKRPARAFSRPAFAPKARLQPPSTPTETQVRPKIAAPPAPPTETQVRPKIAAPPTPPTETQVRPKIASPPAGARSEIPVPPRIPHIASAAHTEEPARQRILRAPSAVPSQNLAREHTLQSPSAAAATGAPPRFRMAQSPSVRDRIRCLESSSQLR